MSKSETTPIEGIHYTRLDSGIIVVARHFEHIDAAYEKEPIPDYLSLVDHHGHKIKSKHHYEKLLEQESNEFLRLRQELEAHKKFGLITINGRDAAGKSGSANAFRDAVHKNEEIFSIIHCGKPDPGELLRFWFWKYLCFERQPKIGHLHVFDRAWQERVLVELVKQLTSEEDIQKSYGDIRLFHQWMTSMGAILVNFWMDVSYDEQLRRFIKRANENPDKINKDDQEARDRWDDYTDAANEMIHRTGTDFAPLYIVPSDHKLFAHVHMIRIVNKTMRAHMCCK